MSRFELDDPSTRSKNSEKAPRTSVENTISVTKINHISFTPVNRQKQEYLSSFSNADETEERNAMFAAMLFAICSSTRKQTTFTDSPVCLSFLMQ